MVNLETPVGSLKMVGPVYAKSLEKLGVFSVSDLLYHIPFRYEDFSLVSEIKSLQEGENVTVIAVIEKFTNIFTKSNKRLQKLQVKDDTGKLDVIFFNAPYLRNIFKPGLKIALTGTIKIYLGKLSFIAPGYEIVSDGSPLLHSGRLVPVYPETEGISSKWLRTRIGAIINKINIDIPEILPGFILEKYSLMDLKKALYEIHFPDSLSTAGKARLRLSFNELLLTHLKSEIRKKENEKVENKFIVNLKENRQQLEKFINSLPFELTPSQKQSVDEIISDLSKTSPMNRLLQGDVGSGKTVISLIAAYLCALNGFKSLLMAPTEILAVQHYRTFKTFLEPFGLNIRLVTSESKEDFLKENSFDILIGTHALLFRKLGSSAKIGLVIIDEQQRFGVEQRSALRQKSGFAPHLLSMTATPIPRTIALTLYSDLDMSVIRELPHGRLPVKTYVVPPVKRESAYAWIKKEITESNYQKAAFIICPLIEESETLVTVKSAKKEFENLKNSVFRDLKLGLIHGRLKPVEKEKILGKYKDGSINILVATPVVEVGIDIARATVILIEASERFGLSQLHQLRGRVGRGSVQSYCLLFTENTNPKTINRLKILEKNHVGIEIAENDLKLRGPGEIWGIKQHGAWNLKFSDLSDLETIKDTKETAIDLLNRPGLLESLTHLQALLRQDTIQNISLD